MWIQVRSMDGRKSVRVDNLSKLTTIEELRVKLSSDFDAAPDKQRLFYRGKQLEDGHSLFDYDVGLNDIIQLLVPNNVPQLSDDHASSAEDSEEKMELSICDEARSEQVEKRKKPECDGCKDDSNNSKCCACSVCGGKQDPDKQILCDECDMAFHIWCLDPPLIDVPDEDDWYCPQCKTDVSEVIKAGEKPRLSKKKANMVSKKQETKRHWGKGMACVGRTKVCTLVPSNHFGPIPGVPVGSLWKFRVQVSEAGVHRPQVAGIHGRENEGAYSIVLSGGYEDDKDEGEEFTYSGSGGRDFSGNKRRAKQSMDQKLTAMNKALAKNCYSYTELSDESGATATHWWCGKPVRVVRNYKGRKFSDYAPVEGNRYDGIYKVVKYWPAKNSAGLVVWKYLLRRDDPASPPWTEQGKMKLGLTMQYPDGFLESQASSSQSHSDHEDKTNKGKKRKASDSTHFLSPSAKHPHYELTKLQKALIKADTKNKKVWDTLLETAQVAGLLSRIQEAFSCIVCQELIYKPVITECGHSICQACLQHSFSSKVYTCPNCRYMLGKDFSIQENKELQTVLLDMFPGYGSGR